MFGNPKKDGTYLDDIRTIEVYLANLSTQRITLKVSRVKLDKAVFQRILTEFYMLCAKGVNNPKIQEVIDAIAYAAHYPSLPVAPDMIRKSEFRSWFASTNPAANTAIMNNDVREVLKATTRITNGKVLTLALGDIICTS